jgi:type IV pilus assembly protein PilE
MHHRHGYSLIELLLVLSIVAILVALAVPAYGRYAYRARRVEGKELLLRIAQAQELHYASYSRYGELSELGFHTPTWSQRGFYWVALRLGAGDRPQTFVATAWPSSMQAGDACGALSIDEAGRKTPLMTDVMAYSNGACW